MKLFDMHRIPCKIFTTQMQIAPSIQSPHPTPRLLRGNSRLVVNITHIMNLNSCHGARIR